MSPFASLRSLVATSTLLAPLALAGLTAAGCKTAKSAEPSPQAAASQPVHVETTTAAARMVPSYLRVTGQLKSSRETDLAANAAGRVTQVAIERGQEVKAGDVLASLDVRAARLSAAEAKAMAETASENAKTARTECERAKSLLDSQAIARAEYDRIEAQCRTTLSQVSAAQARSSLAAQNVGDGQVRAPFSGFVSERFIDVGEYVMPNSKVATLVDLSSLRLELTVPETQIKAARKDAPVTFTVGGYDDKIFAGKVLFVGASVRAQTRDIVAEASVENAEGLLRPGMFASVRLVSGEEKAVIVPAASLAVRDGKKTAFVLAGGRLEQRIVQTGDAFGDDVAVLRGVEEGERVVVKNLEGLKNGQPAQ